MKYLNFSRIFVFLALIINLIFPLTVVAISQEECERKLINDEGIGLEEVEQCEDIFIGLINEAAKQEKSLTSEISRFNREISLTNTRILQAEEQLKILANDINLLEGRIFHLDLSLNEISALLLKRIEKTYKNSRTDPLTLLLSSDSFSQFLSRLQYFRMAQKHDKELLYQIQEAKINYEDQKVVKETKQEEQEKVKKNLDLQKIVLAKQKQDKETFLQVTQNDKRRFDQMLEEARREAQAILTSQFSNKKHVNKGEAIGLMGNTGFSFGAHLHFGVYNLGENEASNFDYFSRVENPLSYLENRSLFFEGTSCDDALQSLTKNVGSGGWSWPMATPRITQCFGHTPWSWRYAGDFHHGIDMTDKEDVVVRAVEEGEAYFYRGETSFGNNVRIFHPNGKMTLYLHLQ